MSETTSSPDLRDHLAGHIITGLLTAPARPGVPPKSVEQLAMSAYQIADIMIVARNAKPTT